MSRYRSAIWRPIRDTSRVALRKDILCFHTIVGGARSCWSYFDRLDVQPYSHGIIGGIWGSDQGHDLDGVAWQIADTDYRAAANLDGNWRIISWETADNATRPIAPWTPAQCDRIVRIMVEAHQVDGIPLVLIPDTLPGRRGVAYHRQGCNPYRVAGGELWSSAFGKDCPTDPRIRQLPGLIERARAVVAGQTLEVDPLAGITIDDIRAVVQEEVTAQTRELKGHVNGIYQLLGYGDRRDDTAGPDPKDTHAENLQRIRQEVAALDQKVDGILDRLPVEPPA